MISFVLKIAHKGQKLIEKNVPDSSATVMKSNANDNNSDDPQLLLCYKLVKFVHTIKCTV